MTEQVGCYRKAKYIIVTGGVLSGLGKGIATASIGCLLKETHKVIPVKCDGYLNSDPGTINPIEHGEVFVLDDGGEVDMDFGHYERFIGLDTKREWNITMGKIYKGILERERRGDYLGRTVQLIPHVTDAIKENIYGIAKREEAELVLIEIGGTVGDMEIELFVESVRQMAGEVGREKMLFVHLTHVPIPANVNELKSKPTQQSVKILNQFGIYPDVIIGRCQGVLTEGFKEKISLHCNISKEAVISGRHAEVIYEVPLLYKQEGLDKVIRKRLDLCPLSSLEKLEGLVGALKESYRRKEADIRLGLSGKYTQLEDSYASIHEAIGHVSAHLQIKIETTLVETSELNEENIKEVMSPFDAMIVPGGFGMRGIGGKIQVIRYVREKKIPFLGICLGMQLAVIEYARHVVGLEKATTREIEQEGMVVDAAMAVVDTLDEQREISHKGGTMRLGGHAVILEEDTLAHRLYEKKVIRERFRHRYEINPRHVSLLEEHGLIFSGKAADRDLVQMMELPGHPFFIGSQFHPELTSRLEHPSCLFYGLIEASLRNKRRRF